MNKYTPLALIVIFSLTGSIIGTKIFTQTARTSSIPLGSASLPVNLDDVLPELKVTNEFTLDHPDRVGTNGTYKISVFFPIQLRSFMNMDLKPHIQSQIPEGATCGQLKDISKTPTSTLAFEIKCKGNYSYSHNLFRLI